MHESAAGTDDGAVDALLVASRALVAVAARSLADAGDITLPQYRALIVLAGRPGLAVADLAAALDVHSSTATRLCDRLVRKKLVRRTPSADDRRSTRLYLAAEGRRIVEQVTDRRRRDLAAIVDRLPAGTTAQVVDVLAAFAAAAGELQAGDLFGWEYEGRGTGPV